MLAVSENNDQIQTQAGSDFRYTQRRFNTVLTGSNKDNKSRRADKFLGLVLGRPVKKDSSHDEELRR